MSMLTFDDSVLAVAHWFPQLTSTSVPAVWSLCRHVLMAVVQLCHQKGRAPWAGLPSHTPSALGPPVLSPACPSPVLHPLERVPYSPFSSSHTLAFGSLFTLNSLPGSFLVRPSGSHPAPASTWMHTQDRRRQAFAIMARGHCPRLRGHTFNCMCHSL